MVAAPLSRMRLTFLTFKCGLEKSITRPIARHRAVPRGKANPPHAPPAPRKSTWSRLTNSGWTAVYSATWWPKSLIEEG
jgi:hypothetical protein